MYKVAEIKGTSLSMLIGDIEHFIRNNKNSEIISFSHSYNREQKRYEGILIYSVDEKSFRDDLFRY